MRQQDLIRLWDEHTADEFVIRDAEATLATMTDDAYVNHISAMASSPTSTSIGTRLPS